MYPSFLQPSATGQPLSLSLLLLHSLLTLIWAHTSPLLPPPSGAGKPVRSYHSGEAVDITWLTDKVEEAVDEADERVLTEEDLLVEDHGDESSGSSVAQDEGKNDFVVRVSSFRNKGSNRDDKMWRRCDRSIKYKEKDEPWITMAVLLPNDTKYEPCLENVLPAILKAVKDARKRGLLVPHDNETAGNGKVEVVPRDSKCTANYANLGAVEAYANDCANVIFGPSCEFAVASVARFVPFWDIPLLTAGGFTYDFTNPKTDPDSEYYMLTRLGISFRDIAFTIMATTDKFNWEKMLLMYDVDGYSSVSGTQTCKMMMSTLVWYVKNSTKTYSSYDMQKNAKDGLLENLRREVGTTYGVIVICANTSKVREILLAAEELNMVASGEYVFFNIELFSSLRPSDHPWFDPHDTDERNSRAKKAYEALLTVTARTPRNPEYRRFSKEVNLMAKERTAEMALGRMVDAGGERNYYNISTAEDEAADGQRKGTAAPQEEESGVKDEEEAPVSTFVTAFYDAVILYALALNETLANKGSVRDGEDITKRMWNKTFTGITGNVTIDANGDRIADYSLLDMDPETFTFKEVAHYEGATGTLVDVPGAVIHWAGGRTTPPPDTPLCGFDNSLCPDNSLPVYAILSIVLSSVGLILPVVSIIIYRRHKLEAEIASMTWRVMWSEVVVVPQRGAGGGRGSIHSLAKPGSMASNSEDITSIAEGNQQVFIPIGWYKGCKVAIKTIKKNRIELTRNLLLELKRMKDLHHDHLVRFIGACVDPPYCCLLTEYCPRGSLQDVLENEQITLDWTFRYSLMHDIVKAMSYLHSSEIRTHGSLKSSNCVVDSRFVLKITDFGLQSLRENKYKYPLCADGPGVGDDSSETDTYAYWRSLLWTAPELLRMPNPPPEGTQKGDVYSFAIIVHEILTRQGPFYLSNPEHQHLTPQDIVLRVCRGVKDKEAGEEPFRPSVEAGVVDSCEEEVATLMRRCWAEDPPDRPDFQALKSAIRRLNKDYESGNILDNLLSRMEQYANNLEALVEERTADYLEEKRKCEELLYQLLPKTVANQLIQGQSVIAETYDSVTIYFSDIVGFTSLSAASTPMQVVDLLNDLYTCFDSIVENYDVYKVETIGDAYMVVSGLPVRNENRHAREVARMALALLNAVLTFKIRHRPNEQLKLRIGLHTGPCVAGVVGLKMPRYCLFGDTVNTASRMESNGLPLKIHVSPATKEVLDTFGTFILELRGEVEMKGKGKMTTFWLKGEKLHQNLMGSNPLHSSLGSKEEVTTCSQSLPTNKALGMGSQRFEPVGKSPASASSIHSNFKKALSPTNSSTGSLHHKNATPPSTPTRLSGGNAHPGDTTLEIMMEGLNSNGGIIGRHAPEGAEGKRVTIDSSVTTPLLSRESANI